MGNGFGLRLLPVCRTSRDSLHYIYNKFKKRYIYNLHPDIVFPYIKIVIYPPINGLRVDSRTAGHTAHIFIYY